MKAPLASTTLLALLALPASVRATPSVTSDSDCPSAAVVTASLIGLLPAGVPESAMARIRTQGERQVVELSSESEPVRSRELPEQLDCEARAQAAVLIIASWLDALPAATFDPPEITAPPVPPPSTTPPAAPATDTRPRRVWLGLGVLGMLDTMGPNLGLTGEVGIDRAVGRLGLAIAMSAALGRDVSVGQGTARWWRPALEVALRLPVVTGDWNLEASLGPAIGLIVLQGRGYDENSSDVVRAWGASAGLRSCWALGRTRLWLDVKGRLWPETQRIRNEVQGVKEPQTKDLPRWEGFLGLGVSLAIL